MFIIEDFDIKLDTDYVGRNFFYFDEIDSTNSFLISSKDITENGSLVLAEYQLKGRGRRQRDWVSVKEQSLLFSILLNKEPEILEPNLLNLTASLSVAQAIENMHQLDVELKWPNDVLVKKKKIAGILLESVSQGNTLEKVVVGVGINVNQPNFKGKYQIPPTSIKIETKRNVNREKLLSEVLNIFEENMGKLISNKNIILHDWRARCKMIGEKIKIIDNETERFGIFDDINEKGFLLFRTPDKTETIHFGDVSLR